MWRCISFCLVFLSRLTGYGFSNSCLFNADNAWCNLTCHCVFLALAKTQFFRALLKRIDTIYVSGPYVNICGPFQTCVVPPFPTKSGTARLGNVASQALMTLINSASWNCFAIATSPKGRPFPPYVVRGSVAIG